MKFYFTVKIISSHINENGDHLKCCLLEFILPFDLVLVLEVVWRGLVVVWGFVAVELPAVDTVLAGVLCVDVVELTVVGRVLVTVAGVAAVDALSKDIAKIYLNNCFKKYFK